MKITVLLFFLFYGNLFGTTFVRGRFDPVVDGPVLRGINVPLRDINTAPNPTPEFDSYNFWLITLYGQEPSMKIPMREEERLHIKRKGKDHGP